MKIQVICTTNGLVPLGDDSYEEKRKLRVGQVYECEVKVVRNYRFLKKAFALLNAAWSLMNERQQAGWRSKEPMLKRHAVGLSTRWMRRSSPTYTRG